jgi:hypothetical protein
MHYQCPSCHESFEAYEAARDHDHQVFTIRDDGGVVDLALPPGHPEVTTSPVSRWWTAVKQAVSRLVG